MSFRGCDARSQWKQLDSHLDEMSPGMRGLGMYMYTEYCI